MSSEYPEQTEHPEPERVPLSRYEVLGLLLKHLEDAGSSGVEVKGYGVRGRYYFVDLFHPDMHDGRVVRYWGYVGDLTHETVETVDLDMMCAASGAVEKFLTSVPSSLSLKDKPVLDYVCAVDEYEKEIPIHGFVERFLDRDEPDRGDG